MSVKQSERSTDMYPEFKSYCDTIWCAIGRTDENAKRSTKCVTVEYTDGVANK